MKNRYKQAVNTKPTQRTAASLQMHERLKEGLFLVACACAVFLLVALVSYHADDPAWSSTGHGALIANRGGRVGAYLSDMFLLLFGTIAYLFPVILVSASWMAMQRKEAATRLSWFCKITGWAVIVFSSCGLAKFYFLNANIFPAHAGGMVGDLLGNGFLRLFNQTGTTLIFITALLCGITLMSGLSWLRLIDATGARFILLWQQLKTNYLSNTAQEFTANLPQTEPIVSLFESARIEPMVYMPAVEPTLAIPPTVVIPREVPREKKKVEYEIDPAYQLEPGSLPSPQLLNPPPAEVGAPFSNITFEELSLLVEQRLRDFGVEVRVVAVHPGPVITRFELDLAPGIKVSKINGLAKDIARSLSTVSVRIVEVIPGKSVIGLEIPNEHRELVTLREILESQRYAQARSPISLVLGKDIAGNPVVVDLMKMPHLLAAGTTGSGKSVSLNAMLLSMLFKSTPEQLRLILIDPKMLELSVYDGIPHLLTPVITDMKDASNALRWCVAEMDRRYRLMAALGVRNITGYNQKVNDAAEKGEPIPMPSALLVDAESAKEYLKPLPLIVVIADELADMMMVVGKKVEDLIARIAQKARAAGIHLIIATQRPSVDVITGLIKANIPTRIAFQVSSRIDSRTILDQQGAEQLLGHGDMLYLPPGAGVPVRVHGAYVTDDEVHRVVAAWRSYSKPDYLYEVIEELGDTASGDALASGESDALYDDAVRIVTESRRASISLVQRRLRIGYNRAARIMEEMESAGVVSSMDHSGSREVLASAPPID